MSKTVTIPEREELQRRLISVNSDALLIEKFYPVILEHAGQTVTLTKFSMIWANAIHDFGGSFGNMLAGVLLFQIDDFIDAVVDDSESAAEIKKIFAG